MGDFPGGPKVKTSTLPMQAAQVPSLIRELRSHMPCGTAKKKKREREKPLPAASA